MHPDAHAHAQATGTGPEVAARWQTPDAGAHYGRDRWRSARARERDPRLVLALCRRFGVSAAGPVLDAACGTGRLAPALAALGPEVVYVGADVAREMLAEHPQRALVTAASVFALPFADKAFELALACRLLHHLRDEGTRRKALRELARVSRAWLLVSYWDAGTFAGRRRMRGHRADDRRRPLARAALAADLAAAGCELVATRTSVPWLTMQTFALARVLPPAGT